jgi:hypothetical protein
MRRREFVVGLGGAAAAWPLAARAQQPGGVRRVGVLMNTVATDAKFQSYVAVFIQGLRQLGWVEGHNLRVDVRRSLERRANISGTSLPTSPQAPRKPGSAGVDAPLSPNELLQWLRIRLVRRRVPHHLSWNSRCRLAPRRRDLLSGRSAWVVVEASAEGTIEGASAGWMMTVLVEVEPVGRGEIAY